LGTTTRSEEEIVGYRRALAWVHEKHASIRVTPKTLQRLHKLAQGGFSGDAGQWKRVDNDIMEIMPDGNKKLRFSTVPWKEAPGMVEHLCLIYHDTNVRGRVPPLIACASFVLDFLCIHPFRDGNGRVSRLLTLLLLYHQDLEVGRYISLERIIEENKESYYDALNKSSAGWHELSHELVPWWFNFLSTVRNAYGEFEDKVGQLTGPQPGGKIVDIRRAVEELSDEFTITDVENRCPHVSRDYIRRVLRKMRDAGELRTKGKGRGASWRKTAMSSSKIDRQIKGLKRLQAAKGGQGRKKGGKK